MKIEIEHKKARFYYKNDWKHKCAQLETKIMELKQQEREREREREDMTK